MILYHVTEAITAYETYEVWANDEAEARAAVRDESRRPGLPSHPSGHGDDSEVIDVRPAWHVNSEGK